MGQGMFDGFARVMFMVMVVVAVVSASVGFALARLVPHIHFALSWR
jgi:hypothetical protein